MKGFLKSAWDFLNGKKSAIAAVLGVALAWGQARGLVNQIDATYLSAALTAITGMAVGHKIYKGSQEESH